MLLDRESMGIDDLVPTVEDKGVPDEAEDTSSNTETRISEQDRSDHEVALDDLRKKAASARESLQKKKGEPSYEDYQKVFRAEMEALDADLAFREREVSEAAKDVPNRFKAESPLPIRSLKLDSGKRVAGDGWQIREVLAEKNAYTVVNTTGELYTVGRFTLEAQIPAEDVPIKNGDVLEGYGRVSAVTKDGLVSFESGTSMEADVVRGQIVERITTARDAQKAIDSARVERSQVREAYMVQIDASTQAARDRAKRLAA